MTPKEALEELDTSQLEEQLDRLEKLSRYGSSLSVTAERKKQIIDHVKFLVARAVFK